MKYLRLILLLASGLSFTSCSSSDKTLSPHIFNDSIKSIANAVVIDVRTPEEFSEGYLPNAINIDYKDADFVKNLSTLDKTLPYYIYCKGGVRSAAAAKIMRENGFITVCDLQGGIKAWEKVGLDFVSE